jgi:hypothetical protein
MTSPDECHRSFVFEVLRARNKVRSNEEVRINRVKEKL